MKMSDLIVKRRLNNIGWIDKLNFIDLDTSKTIDLKHYNGRLCFQIGGKRIGYKTFREKSIECSIELTNNCPF